MIRYACPSPDRWTALLREDLSDGEQHDLEAHLDECPDCQRVLETCAADRSAWAAVPRWLSSTAESDAPLRTIIERLKNSPEDGAGSTDMTLDFLDPSEQSGSLGRLNSYEIMEEIGRGGMGVVLKALDPALHRVVAIKVLAPPLAISASYRKRFTREARAAAAVCHEHVVTIHAVEEFKSLPYLVMQYVAGQSLQQKLDSCGPLPVANILRIGTQAAAGLAAAHAQGLVHRDIKPGNILLENGVERVRITDFGLARTIDDVGVTSSGVITGTPQYMAPEQARGQTVDARADLFSLGSVLYAMCTGEAPFHGSHALDVLRKVAEDQPRPIRELNYAIPPWLVAIVTKFLAKDPAQRFQSASEVAELLERCLAHVQSPNTVALPFVVTRLSGSLQTSPRRRTINRWAALVLPILAGLFVVSEGTGATHIVKSLGTILRFRTPEGTLVVEVDDPAVKVTLDDKDLVIIGAGAQEVRLKVGSHTVRATKDGQTKSEIVSIEKNGKATVKVSFEADGLQRPIADPNAKPAQPGFVKDLPRFALQFHNEPWAAVFEDLDNLTGFSVIARVKPIGTFTFRSPKDEDGLSRQYKLAEVIDIVNDALMQQNFLLVRRRTNLIVIQTDEKINPTYFEHVPSYELEQRGKTELVTYVVRMEHARGWESRAELQKLMSPIGMATTIPGGGISISDKAENVRRIVQVLTDLDHRESQARSRLGQLGLNLPPSAPPKSDERKFRVEFRDQPFDKVFEWFGENSKMPVIANFKPTGTFSLFPAREYTLGEFFDLMNDSLMQQKLLLVRRDNSFLVVRTDEKLDLSYFRDVPLQDELHRYPRTELAQVGYTFNRGNPQDFRVAVEKLLSPLGRIGVSDERKNILFIADSVSNLRTIVRVLGELENGPTGGALDRNAKPGSAPAPPPDPNDPRFSASFPGESWPDFFDRLSKLSGLAVVAPIKPDGNFFGITPPPLQNGRPLGYTLDDLIDAVNNQLYREQFFLARRSDKLELFPTDKRLDPAKFTSVSLEELPKRRKTDLVALDFQLKYTVAAYAAEFLKPFHGPLGSSNGTNRTNRVLIRDTAERVQSIVRVLAELEGKTKEGGINRNSEAATPGDPSLGGGNGQSANVTERPTRLFVTKPRFEFPIKMDNNLTGVFAMAITPDGKRVATTNSNGTTTIWNAQTGELLLSISGQEIGRCTLALSPDGRLLAIGGRMRGIRLVDTSSGKIVHALEGPEGIIQEMAFSTDGKWFTSGASNADGDDSEARLWRLYRDGKPEIRDFGKHTGTKVTSVSFSPDGDSVISGYAAGQVIEVKIEDGQLNNGRVWAELQSPIRRIAIEPKRRLMAVAYGAEGDVCLCSLSKPLSPVKQISTIHAHARPISSLAFSPDGTLLVTASADGTSKVWDVATGKLAVMFAPAAKREAIEAAAFTPDSKEIVTAGDDGIVRFWPIPVAPAVLPEAPAGASFQTLRFEGRISVSALAAAAPIALICRLESKDRNYVSVWDVATDREITRLPLNFPFEKFKGKSFVPLLAISADGKFAALTMGNTLIVWEVATRKRLKDSTVHAGDISALAFGSGSRLVATAGQSDELVRIWDVASGNEVRQFRSFTTPATILAFSPDGAKLLASDGSVIRVLAVADGEEIDHRIPMRETVRAATFLPNGEVAAAVGGSVIVWKPGKDQKVRRFGGLEGRIVALNPVAGGHGLLTGDSNGFVRLWNIENGRQIRQVSLPGIIGALSIGPDETTCSCTLPETAEGLKVVTYKADRSLPDSRP